MIKAIKLSGLCFLSLFEACMVSTEKMEFLELNIEKVYSKQDVDLAELGDLSYFVLNSDREDYLYNLSRLNWASGIFLSPTKIGVADANSGDCLFFSADGYPLSRFNHKGQGANEYTFNSSPIYDESTDELFVRSFNTLFVYSSEGVYKRKLHFPKEFIVTEMWPYDDQVLFCYAVQSEITKGVFFFFNKMDGKVETVLVPDDSRVDLSIPMMGGGMVRQPKSNHIIPSQDGFNVHNPENDTVFFLAKNKQLSPILVQSPSIASMTNKIFVNNFIETSKYNIIEYIQIDSSSPKKERPSSLLHDKESGEIVEPRYLLTDYSGKALIVDFDNVKCVTEKNTYILFELSLLELKEAEKEGRLTGELKSLVDNLNEEKDNNVYIKLKLQ